MTDEHNDENTTGWPASALRPSHTQRPAQTPPEPKPRMEWTPKRVQNVLLTVGSGLCAIAALSFIAANWSNIGLGGRTAIMAALTVATIVIAAILKRRSLDSSAEAVMAIGYVLTFIDLGSAYSLNLLGVHSVALWQYFAVTSTLVSILAIAHAKVTKIQTSSLVATIASQVPVPAVLIGVQSGYEIAGAALIAQALATATVFGRATKLGISQILKDIGYAFALISGLIAAVFALGSTAASTLGFASAEPMVLFAAGLVAVTFLVEDFRTSRANALTAFAALCTLNAVIHSVRLFDGREIGLAISVVGAVVVVLSALKVRINHLHIVGFTTVGLGSAFVGPDLMTALAAPQVATASAIDFAILAIAAASLIARRDRLSMTVAAIAGIAMVDLVPFVAGFSITQTMAFEGVLAAICVLAPNNVVRSRYLNYSALASGAVISLQFALAASATDIAAPVITGFMTVVSIGLAATYRKEFTVLATVATGSLLAFVGTLAAHLNIALPDVGAIVLLCAELMIVTFVRTRRTELEPSLYAAICGAVIGASMSVHDTTTTSFALASLAATSAAIGMMKKQSVFGWISASLVVALIWQRLSIAHVTAPEAYTLPLSLLLGAFGYAQWRRPERTLSSTQAFGIALAVGFGPSLIEVMHGGSAIRTLGLLIGGSVALLVGAQLRMRAPIVAGTVTVAITALVEAAPYFHYVPRWLAIGVVGVTLVAVGATWEARRRELRAAKMHFKEMV